MSKLLTYDEVETILNEYKKNKNTKYIQTHVPHRSTGSIEQIICKHKRYKKGEIVDGPLMGFFKLYNSGELPVDNKNEQSTPTHTFSIDEAIDQLKTAIVQFIDEQVTEQKQKEVQALKQEYETKLQDMQSVMVQAQKTSVIDMLRQKWGHL